jgi:hypothetical protein
VEPTFLQRALAMVLAAGDGAFASHETAIALRTLPLPGPAFLEVTTNLERRPYIPGVRMHRSGLVGDDDVTVVDGIRTATAELAIVSTSSRYSLRILGRMVDDAVRRKIMTLDSLAELVDRLPPAPGRSRKKMRAVLERRLPGVEERESALEDFVVFAIDRFGLPMPVFQHPVTYEGQQRRVDACYVDEALALEAKGFQWYQHRSTFDRDALRGNELLHVGYRVLTFTSAFSDYQIACDIAVELRLPQPAWQRPLSYLEWARRR